MSIRRIVKKMGGSLGVLIPRDVAEAIGVSDGAEIEMTVVGRQVVIESARDSADDATFRRAMGAVLRRHKRGLVALAEYDEGRGPLVAMVGPGPGLRGKP